MNSPLLAFECEIWGVPCEFNIWLSYVSVVLHALNIYIGTCYNRTRLYFQKVHFNFTENLKQHAPFSIWNMASVGSVTLFENAIFFIYNTVMGIRFMIYLQPRCCYKCIPTHGARFVVSSWWRHQMKKNSSLLALCAGNSPIPGESPPPPPTHTHKGQWRGALMFSSICAWINAWVKLVIWDASAPIMASL